MYINETTHIGTTYLKEIINVIRKSNGLTDYSRHGMGQIADSAEEREGNFKRCYVENFNGFNLEMIQVQGI